MTADFCWIIPHEDFDLCVCIRRSFVEDMQCRVDKISWKEKSKTSHNGKVTCMFSERGSIFPFFHKVVHVYKGIRVHTPFLSSHSFFHWLTIPVHVSEILFLFGIWVISEQRLCYNRVTAVHSACPVFVYMLCMKDTHRIVIVFSLEWNFEVCCKGSEITIEWIGICTYTMQSFCWDLRVIQRDINFLEYIQTLSLSRRHHSITIL